jgi:hypothetical protein
MFVGSDRTVIGGGRRDWGSMCFNVPGVESGGGGSGWWWGVASCKGCGNDGRSPIRTSLKGFGCGSTINCLLRLGVLNYKRDEPARLTDHVKKGEAPVGAPYLVVGHTSDGDRFG